MVWWRFDWFPYVHVDSQCITRVDTKINGHEDKRFSEICIFSLNKQK